MRIRNPERRAGQKGAGAMEIIYNQNREYRIPDIQMSQPEQPIGKYGLMRKTFLREHRKAQYNTLLMTGKLAEHLIETDREVRRQVEATIEVLRNRTQEPDILILGIRCAMIPFDIIQKVNDRPEIL